MWMSTSAVRVPSSTKPCRLGIIWGGNAVTTELQGAGGTWRLRS